NLAALAATIVVVVLISRLLDSDAITTNCTVVLAVLAPTLLAGELAALLSILIPPGISGTVLAAFWDGRALPPLQMYLNTTPMPVGMAVNLIGFYQLLQFLKPQRAGESAEGRPRLAGRLSLVIASIILLGYIYPFLWISMCLMVVACAAVGTW